MGRYTTTEHNRTIKMNFKTEKELEAMDKKQIDAYGDSIGMNLDRRLKKGKLIKQVMEEQERILEADVEEAVNEIADEPEDAPLEVPAVEATPIPDPELEAPEFETLEEPGWKSTMAIVGGVVLFVVFIVILVKAVG